MKNCLECGTALPPQLNPSSVCADCEAKHEQALERLHVALVSAKETYEKSRAIAEDLGRTHRDGAYGLQLATRDYAEATIVYSRALIERTQRRLPDKTQSNEKPN